MFPLHIGGPRLSNRKSADSGKLSSEHFAGKKTMGSHVVVGREQSCGRRTAGGTSLFPRPQTFFFPPIGCKEGVKAPGTGPGYRTQDRNAFPPRCKRSLCPDDAFRGSSWHPVDVKIMHVSYFVHACYLGAKCRFFLKAVERGSSIRIAMRSL